MVITLEDPPTPVDPPTQAAALLPYHEHRAPTGGITMEEFMGALVILPVHDAEEVVMCDAMRSLCARPRERENFDEPGNL